MPGAACRHRASGDHALGQRREHTSGLCTSARRARHCQGRATTGPRAALCSVGLWAPGEGCWPWLLLLLPLERNRDSAGAGHSHGGAATGTGQAQREAGVISVYVGAAGPTCGAFPQTLKDLAFFHPDAPSTSRAEVPGRCDRLLAPSPGLPEAFPDPSPRASTSCHRAVLLGVARNPPQPARPAFPPCGGQGAWGACKVHHLPSALEPCPAAADTWTQAPLESRPCIPRVLSPSPPLPMPTVWSASLPVEAQVAQVSPEPFSPGRSRQVPAMAMAENWCPSQGM